MILESVYQRKVISKYEALGYYVIKLIKTNKQGIPDLLCLKSGEIPLFVEVKRKGGKVSQLQEYRLKELRQLGFKAEVDINK